MASKVARVLALLFRAPVEVGDRCAIRLESAVESLRPRPVASPASPWREVSEALAATSGRSATEILGEANLGHVLDEVHRSSLEIAEICGIDPVHDADPVLLHASYLAVRLVQPAVVVETGVGRGVSTAILLAALEANGKGELHSIDLPPLTADDQRDVGILVPAGCRARWTLHRGLSKRLLPGLVARLGPVGVFVHDSLHTRKTIIWELREVSARLARPAAVVVDDVEGHDAFVRWVEESSPRFWRVAAGEKKASAIGVALF